MWEMGVLVWLLPLFGGLSWAHEAPVADTPLGTVKGYWAESRSGRGFMGFSGLPYARPPVGRLRFQPPEPATPWNGVRIATVDGPFCIQFSTFRVQPYPEGEEDCLYLSLYTHSLTNSAPVLVHFHGGGFLSGNGARMGGPQYFMDQDILLVDVNYRVGIFGFLSFEDDLMPGNQGLKDQVMALRWVQENIASFGGDPTRVTIIGESAGAASVYHHIVSPLSKGLFHQAIAESGSSYNIWAVAPPGYTKNNTMRLLAYVGCESYSTEEAVACLSSKDPKQVISKLELFRVWQVDPIITFGPVFEEDRPGSFLVGPSRKWEHAPVPILMGTTSAEGLLRTLYFMEYNMDYKWFSYHFADVVPLSLGYCLLSPNQDEVTKAIRHYYFPNGEISRNDWVNLTMMYSDALFLKGILDGANKHPGKVFFYYFDYVGEKSFAGMLPNRNKDVVFGAYHTDELLYLWNYYGYEGLQHEDLKLSQDLIEMWTNFATFGTPTPGGVQWTEWTPTRNRYLNISKEGYRMEEGLASERYKFWQEIENMVIPASMEQYQSMPSQWGPGYLEYYKYGLGTVVEAL